MLWSAFASAAGALSRSGPIVPFELAGWKVWHVAQPFEAKTALPAAAFPPPEEVVVAPVDVAEVVGEAEVVVVEDDPPPTVTVRTLEGLPPSDV